MAHQLLFGQMWLWNGEEEKGALQEVHFRTVNFPIFYQILAIRRLLSGPKSKYGQFIHFVPNLNDSFPHASLVIFNLIKQQIRRHKSWYFKIYVYIKASPWVPGIHVDSYELRNHVSSHVDIKISLKCQEENHHFAWKERKRYTRERHFKVRNWQQ